MVQTGDYLFVVGCSHAKLAMLLVMKAEGLIVEQMVVTRTIWSGHC